MLGSRPPHPPPPETTQVPEEVVLLLPELWEEAREDWEEAREDREEPMLLTVLGWLGSWAVLMVDVGQLDRVQACSAEPRST